MQIKQLPLLIRPHQMLQTQIILLITIQMEQAQNHLQHLNNPQKKTLQTLQET